MRIYLPSGPHRRPTRRVSLRSAKRISDKSLRSLLAICAQSCRLISRLTQVVRQSKKETLHLHLTYQPKNACSSYSMGELACTN